MTHNIMSCPDCTKGGVLPGEPTGHMNDDNSYLAPAPTGGSSSRAIVLLSDAFGLPLKNTKILADNFAQRLACDVWVPDLFAGAKSLYIQTTYFKPDENDRKALTGSGSAEPARQSWHQTVHVGLDEVLLRCTSEHTNIYKE